VCTHRGRGVSRRPSPSRGHRPSSPAGPHLLARQLRQGGLSSSPPADRVQSLLEHCGIQSESWLPSGTGALVGGSGVLVPPECPNSGTPLGPRLRFKLPAVGHSDRLRSHFQVLPETHRAAASAELRRAAQWTARGAGQ
jgi:hypothetical protein